MSHHCGHPPNLAIAAFMQSNFQPGCWDVLAKANWRVSRRQAGLSRQKFHLRRACSLSLDQDAFSELPQRCFVRSALHLHPICPRVLEARIGEPVLQSAIVGEQHQAFTVMIQPPARIEIFYGNEIRKALSLTGKLAEHSIRLMKKDVAEGHPSDYLKKRKGKKHDGRRH